MFAVISCSGSVYSNVLEDGNQSLSRDAAQSLQASGPAAEPTYANVERSKKKRKGRKPPTDKYGQVYVGVVKTIRKINALMHSLHLIVNVAMLIGGTMICSSVEILKPLM